MKKILFSLIFIISLLVAVPVSAEGEKVPVYMFSKDGCSACIAAVEYFDELNSNNPGLFELKEIVVFDENFEPVNNDRTNLLVKVYERFGEDTSKAATPTIVIGNYHTVGLPQDTSVVFNAIKKVKNEKTEDEVLKLVNELELDLDELLEYEGNSSAINNNATAGKYDTLIIVGIFVVLIGGLAALVVIGKK